MSDGSPKLIAIDEQPNDQVVHTLGGLDQGIGHLTSVSPKNERLSSRQRLKRVGDLAILSHMHEQARD